MAKARGTEAKLARLRALRTAPQTAELEQELSNALADASNLVVAEAAAVIGMNQVRTLAPQLVAAFDRLMIDPEERDKQCRGKIAIAEALNQLEFAESEVFLRGIAHRQDPVWDSDPKEDAAGLLRASCALGLARLNHPDRLLYLTDLLLDTDKTARAGAARALGNSGSLAAVPLLRYKAQNGDRDPQVIGECLQALLTLTPAQSLPFVTGFLHNPDPAVQEAAVFALSESRRPEALTALLEFWPHVHRDLLESLLLAISMFRLPAALDFLTGLITRKDPNARAAVTALAIHRHAPKIKETVAVAAHGAPEIEAWFRKKFADADGDAKTDR
jgi:HEAT repeat protein